VIRAKGNGNIQSLRPSDFAPAFGRAEAASRRVPERGPRLKPRSQNKTKRIALSRDGTPKLTPPAELAVTPISDDETVAKMGHPNLDMGHPATGNVS